MTDSVYPESAAFGKLLAELPPEEREQARQQARMVLLANMPDDEVDKPPIKNLGEYLDNEITLPPALVAPGIVYRGAITAMTSRGGKGKTSLMLNRLLRWSMERPLFDELPEVLKPTAPLRSLIIENEGAPGHFQHVIRTILHGERNGDPIYSEENREAARENIHIWGDGGWSGLKLDEEDNFKRVGQAVALAQADIVFIEPFRGLWRGNENDASEMSNVLDKMSELASDHGCAVIVTHHERKGGEASEDGMSKVRGSTAFEGHCGVIESWSPVKAGRLRELSYTKARFEEAPAPMRMQFDRESWSYTYIPPEAGGEDVLRFMSQFPDRYFSVKQIGEEIEEPYEKVRKWCAGLAADDRIKKEASGGQIQYRFTNAAGGDDTDALAIS